MKLIDFYKKVANRYLKKKKMILTIRITERCNFNCSFCVNKEDRLNGKSRDFTYKDLLKIKDEICKHKPIVMLMGGELFLNKDLLKIIRLLRSMDIEVIVFTNGFFVSENLKGILKSNLDKISFSLDHYILEKHNKLRGNFESYQRIMASIRELSDLYINSGKRIFISITTVINKENYKDLVQMYKFIEKTNLIDQWSLQHLLFYNTNAFLLDNKYEIDEILGQFIDKKPYFSKNELVILRKNILEIKELEKKFKTKLRLENDINVNLENYYSGDILPFKSCEGLNQIKIKKNRVYNKCGLLLGDMDDGVYNLFNSKKNRNFIEHVKKKQIIQCFRCCARKF